MRDIDYNPNKQKQVVTCGDDCMIRVWDLRNTNKPLLQLSDHTHWVWSVSYNPSHDQLLVSCGSDYQVNLQSIVSVSSVPTFSAAQDFEGYEWYCQLFIIVKLPMD